MKARKTLNKPLLRRLARKLRRLRHEEHYNQRTWGRKTACGTAACIAGHVALMAGYRLVGGCGCDQCLNTLDWARKSGWAESEPVKEVAARELGLSDIAADALFTGAPAGGWPKAFRERWLESDPEGPPKQRPSRIAADLLDAIADTNGKVLA